MSENIAKMPVMNSDNHDLLAVLKLKILVKDTDIRYLIY